jgi:hypothetical protein
MKNYLIIEKIFGIISIFVLAVIAFIIANYIEQGVFLVSTGIENMNQMSIDIEQKSHNYDRRYFSLF